MAVRNGGGGNLSSQREKNLSFEFLHGHALWKSPAGLGGVTVSKRHRLPIPVASHSQTGAGVIDWFAVIGVLAQAYWLNIYARAR